MKSAAPLWTSLTLAIVLTAVIVVPAQSDRAAGARPTPQATRFQQHAFRALAAKEIPCPENLDTRTTKDQVAFMVQQQLRLREPPAPADAADGVAAALCHCMIGAFPR